MSAREWSYNLFFEANPIYLLFLIYYSNFFRIVLKNCVKICLKKFVINLCGILHARRKGSSLLLEKLYTNQTFGCI